MTITSLNIADGTVGRSRLPKLKKKFIAITAIILILLIGVSLIIYYKIYSSGQKNAQEILKPPNPTKSLPPSSSLLHKFKKAAVCADGPPCAEIGRKILEKNGSAVDAAIATLFCNGIFTMQSMGLGGGFLMTIYIKDDNKAYCLNAREKAPFNSRIDLYEKSEEISRKGPLSIAVPGELKGYWTAHQRFGKLSWKDVVQPSIEFCENGYQISDHQFNHFPLSEKYDDPNFKEWFKLPNGTFKNMGTKVIPKKLCETLRKIAENGGNDLYEGELSKMFLQDVKELGGIITEEDLTNYTAEWMDPIEVKFQNGDQLYSIPPPGSGVLLGFIMNILDGFNFTRESIEDIPNTIVTYHRMIEAFKFAYAKRTELGDLNFVNITELLTNLTSREYADGIRTKINDKSMSSDPKDYGAVFYSREDHGTAHISVSAENGDAVSVTSSINIYFGSGLTSPQTGIILNSVMDDFSFPFFKNYFGLPGSPNNALEPGKRPLSSMAPSILIDNNGDTKLVIGAAGGTKITSGIAYVIARLLWFQDNLKEAVDSPRIYHQLYPMEVQYEYGILDEVVKGLEKLGHKMIRLKEKSSSVICALYKYLGEIIGNADYRKGGDVYGL